MQNIFAFERLRGFALTSLLLVATLPVAVPTTGCTSSQVINEINVVLNEATQVLAVADPSAPWLASYKAAVTALQTAEVSWQAGGTVQIVISALNTIASITAVIPVTAVYSQLIDVLVAAIDAVLVLLVPSGTAALSAAYNPHVGRYQLQNHWYHTPAGNLKANWNSVAKANGLTQAILK